MPKFLLSPKWLKHGLCMVGLMRAATEGGSLTLFAQDGIAPSEAAVLFVDDHDESADRRFSIIALYFRDRPSCDYGELVVLKDFVSQSEIGLHQGVPATPKPGSF
jgi:hypothetical protein